MGDQGLKRFMPQVSSYVRLHNVKVILLIRVGCRDHAVSLAQFQSKINDAHVQKDEALVKAKTFINIKAAKRKCKERNEYYSDKVVSGGFPGAVRPPSLRVLGQPRAD